MTEISRLEKLTALAGEYRDAQNWDRLTAVVLERHELERAGGRVGLGLAYLAGDLARVGRLELAEQLLERTARELREIGTPEASFEWQTYFSLLCDVQLAKDNLGDAIAACRRSVTIARERGPSYSDYWETHNYLADLLQFRAQDEAAAVSERESLWRYFRGRLTELAAEKGELAYNASVVHVQNGARLAFGYRALGTFAKAVPVYRALVSDLERSSFFGENAIEVPTLLVDLAETYRALGDIPACHREASAALLLMNGHGHGDSALEARAKSALVE